MPQALELSQSGLARRLKRHFLKEEHRFLAICIPGFEEVLHNEILLLPEVGDAIRIHGGVEFSGTLVTMYHANLTLRIATRILLRIETFMCCSYPELFNKIRRIPWELFLGFNPTISFSVTSNISKLHHTGTIEKTIFDGITDAMNSLLQKVTHKENAPLAIYVRFHQDRVTLSIDTSGDLLYKRGYKTSGATAPLRETTAAALLAICDYKRFDCIVDPFCGSGTIPIEAAQGSLHLIPGANRDFAFTQWPSFSQTHYARLKKEHLHSKKETSHRAIYASDINASVVACAQSNAQSAEVAQAISFSVADCQTLLAPNTKNGLILTNTPYGKRLSGTTDLIPFYQLFGKHLKKTFPGWRFGIVMGHETLVRATGLRTDKELSFNHGGLEVVFATGTIS